MARHKIRSAHKSVSTTVRYKPVACYRGWTRYRDIRLCRL